MLLASTTWRTALAVLAATLCTAAPALADDPVSDDDWQDGVSLEDVPTGGVADPGEDDPGRKVPSYIGMCEAADGCDLTADDDGTLGSKGKHATGVAVAAGATDQATAPPDTPVAPAADTTVKVKGTGDDKQVVVADDDSTTTLPCTDDAAHATVCGTAAAASVGTVVWAILRNGRNADGSLKPNVLQRQRMRYIDEVLSDEDATGAERAKAIEYAREMGRQGLTLSSFPRSFQAYVLDDPTWLEHDRPFREIGALGIPEGADARTVQSAQNAWVAVLRYVNGAGEEQWGRAQDVADDLAAEGFTLPDGYRAWAEATAVPAANRGNYGWDPPGDEGSEDHGSDGHSDYDPDDRWPSLDEDFDIPREPGEHRGQDYDGGRVNHADPAADHGRGGGDHGGRAGGADEDGRRVEEDPHRRGSEHVVEPHRGVSHGVPHPVFHGF